MHSLLPLVLLVASVSGFAPPISSSLRQTAGLSTRATFSQRQPLLTPPQQGLAASQEHVETTSSSDTSRVTESFSVTFPPYRDLMELLPGEHFTSSSFSIGKHDFCVLLYPRGGAHSAKKQGGFGMSYKLFPDKDENKVGIYLQYLPKTEDDTVDAAFSLVLKGNQKENPRFDLEWSTGIRFVASSKSNLREGMANDFGAHLMQTALLPTFLGVDDDTNDDESQLNVQVNITVHPTVETSIAELTATEDNVQASSSSRTGARLFPSDIRQVTSPSGEVVPTRHDTERVRVGKIVVPQFFNLNQRRRMFALGAYPGVEYRIMRMFDSNGDEIFTSQPGADYEIRPIYPLVRQLERPWPVRVNEAEIPILFTAGMYNAISAVGSLLTAVGGLALAFLVSQAISFFVIPSRSMDPTLQVGDVLVVEKVTPRILGGNKQVGNVVLFSPPTRLREIVASSGGRITDRDLFVKRIAAGPGDTVSVDSSGSVRVNDVPADKGRNLCGAEPLRLIEKYIQPGDVTIEDKQVFVLGDCSSVSIDSRVWGPLTTDDIVGRPLFRIWPLERFGSVPSLPSTLEADWTD